MNNLRAFIIKLIKLIRQSKKEEYTITLSHDDIKNIINNFEEEHKKALVVDIIDDYNVDIVMLKNSKNVEEYNNNVRFMLNVDYLDESDFEFLKRVFRYE